MQTVRFGVIGLGNMGLYHCDALAAIENARLSAICDGDVAKLAKVGEKYPQAAKFEHYEDLIGSGTIDAVLIATPHYSHPDIAIASFDKKLHVLCEKPAAVSVKEARRMNDAAAKHPDLKYSINFQMRSNPMLRRLREMILAGELGEISRITWIVTNWFRTWAYYASGGWRATWAGEGGGVLINQCPHNLDQLYWLTGMMPTRVTAVAHIGKTHPIEVEDEVSAILEYANGATGHFITTTGETPGTDRLEIAGDKGKIVSEGGKLHFRMTRRGVREFRENDPGLFSTPEVWDVEIPAAKTGADPKIILQNFVNAILRNEPLIAPGEEGAKGLEIGNAMLMAGLTRMPVDLPIDGNTYESFLKELTQKYAGKKAIQTRSVLQSDMGSTFGRA